MLRSLNFENFKAWRKLGIEFGAVTGLFGPNSSGKSCILQFLLMLKQTKNATDRRLVLDFVSSNSLVNLGHFRGVVHKHDEKAILRWEIDWTSHRPVAPKGPKNLPDGIMPSECCLQTESRVAWKRSGLQARYLCYSLGDSTLSLEPIAADEAEFDWTSAPEPHIGHLRGQ